VGLKKAQVVNGKWVDRLIWVDKKGRKEPARGIGVKRYIGVKNKGTNPLKNRGKSQFSKNGLAAVFYFLRTRWLPCFKQIGSALGYCVPLLITQIP